MLGLKILSLIDVIGWVSAAVLLIEQKLGSAQGLQISLGKSTPASDALNSCS
jgi:hypothetical protein